MIHRERAWIALTEAVAACRDHLLYAIRNAIQVPEDYFTWADQVLRRTDGYLAADRVVSDALSDRSQRVLDRMSPEQQHRFWWGDSAAGSDAEWQQAERLAAQVLRQFGFDDAVTTAAGADAGVDVVGAAVAAQVKYAMKPVGRPTLQQLMGAAHGRIAVCFARSGYSKEAIGYADRAGIALFRIHLPISVTAVNQFAARMVNGG
ncbi:restriction endonuclease [Kribbella sp. NPDC000426]|uniref:restriction endonuclease n=1 Tax=Kribbella sp. NPDC000426 TaxID=3154255 RepID=UPI00332C299A